MRILSFLLCFLSFISFAQEKRLALVIGNANYENAPLKNPVNDAILMKETFEKLDFDVIIETDIETHNEFYQIIDDYNKKRENYSVGFIYYAGHAVQIEGDNYMLATKERYESTTDVKYKGLDIEIFTEQFSDPTENEVNVLILDACRDNPFEREIYGSTRSAVNNGLGLAEIKKPPMGSLIAFSTAKGMTAKDQLNDSKNSFYCQILSKYLMLEGVSLHNIFGKVCAEVYYQTKQYPELYDKMMGKDFFLKKSSYTDLFNEVDSLIKNVDFNSARTKVEIILANDPQNLDALLKKGEIELYDFGKKYNAEELIYAAKLYPSEVRVNIGLAEYYYSTQKYTEALKEIDSGFLKDSLNAQLYFVKAQILQASFLNDEALTNFNKAIQLEPSNTKFIYNRGIYFANLHKTEMAINDFKSILDIDSMDIDAINLIGLNYKSIGRTDLALKYFKMGIHLERFNPSSASYCYANKGELLSENGDLFNAIKDVNKAIELKPKESYFYNKRGLCYANNGHFNKALNDFSHSIELDSNIIEFWIDRANLHAFIGNNKQAMLDLVHASNIEPNNPLNSDLLIGAYYSIKEYDLALKEIQKAIDFAKNTSFNKSLYYNWRGTINHELGYTKNAENDFEASIKLAPDYHLNYRDRSNFFSDIGEYKKALKDIDKALELSPDNISHLLDRADLYFYGFNDTTNAFNDLEYILKLNPSNIDALNLYGIIYQELGEYGLAITNYDRGIAEEKNNPISAAYCYQNRGSVHAEQKDFDKAIFDFNKSIELDPNNSDHYWYRAQYYRDHLKLENLAFVDYSKAIECDSTNYSVWLERAYCNQYLDETSSLCDALNAYKLNTNSIDAINFISGLYFRQGNLDSALYYLNRAVLLKDVIPYSLSHSHYLMASIFTEMKEYSSALEHYNLSIKISPEDADFYWGRSTYFNINDDRKSQLEDISKSIELDKSNAQYLSYRGLLYGKMGNYEKAEEDFKKAHTLDKISSSVFLLEAKYFKRKKEYEAAIMALDSAISIDSKDPEPYFYKALIFEELGEIPQAVQYYTLTHFLLTNNKKYSVYDENQNLMRPSEVYQRIGKFYEKIGEYNMMCEEYFKAVEYSVTSQITRINEIKKEVNSKINEFCK